jgi:hypothetical protein
MSDKLTDSQIALLCDIGEYDPSKSTDQQKQDLDWLIFGEYVELTDAHPGSAYKLTPKGAAFLGERGAGLNEA